MKDKVFLDSNVIIYAHTDLHEEKKRAAQQLISSEKSIFISTQVLQEVSNTLSKKFKHSWDDISKVIAQSLTYSLLNTNTAATVNDAIRIASRYNYSFYDSLIIASALECNCSIVYSEDMQSGQKIDETLTIINPFTAL